MNIGVDGINMEVSRKGTGIKVTWRITDSQDVEKARQLFLKLTREGWLAVLPSTKGKSLKRVYNFEPDCGELRFIPLSEGG